MNLRRIIRDFPLEAQIRSFLEITPESVCLRTTKGKTILTVSTSDAEPKYERPILIDNQIVGTLHSSQDGPVASFVMNLIQGAVLAEQQLTTVRDETLLMYREVNLLYDLSVHLSTLKGRDNRIIYVLEQCALNLKAERVSIWLMTDDLLCCSYHVGGSSDRSFHNGEGVIGSVTKSGTGEMLNCPINDSRWIGKVHKTRSIIIVPMKTDEDTFGVLQATKDDGSHFTAKDLKLANVFTHYSTREIENAEIAHELRVARALLKEASERVQGPLLGDSPAIRALRRDLLDHAKTDDSLLLLGPPGAGEEAIARGIHHLCERREQPFIFLNCLQFQSPEANSKSSFNGLSRDDGKHEDWLGMLELADGGTLYLDAIHSLSIPLQHQLAQFLLAAKTARIDRKQPVPDIRVIAHSSMPLSPLQHAAILQPELARLLLGTVLQVPSLKERAVDIPLLADFFVGQYARRIGKVITKIDKTSLKRITDYSWPGNIRELQNVLERAVVISMDPVLEISEEFVDEGVRVDRYRLINKIGEGGMGEVWRAKHQLLARPAALKLIRTDTLTNRKERRKMLKRFQIEAQTTASLQSPNTVKVFDYGVTEDGAFYFVMELLNGLDLGAILKRFGPLEPERVVVLLKQACRSLMEAHDIGLIHRDIKPQNLFICRLGQDFDFLKILDFGIVQNRRRDDDSDILDESGVPNSSGKFVVSGSPQTIAPEHLDKEMECDGRADLYSLACVAFYMLTRKNVFDGKGVRELLIQHLNDPPRRPSEEAGRHIPRELDDLILWCLAKNPDDRPASAEVLWHELDKIKFEHPWTQDRARQWWLDCHPQVVHEFELNDLHTDFEATIAVSNIDQTVTIDGANTGAIDAPDQV